VHWVRFATNRPDRGCSTSLESTSQEYKATLPIAAWALGRIHHLSRRSPRSSVSSARRKSRRPARRSGRSARSVAAHQSGRVRAGALLDGLAGLEPGAEMVRLTRAREGPCARRRWAAGQRSAARPRARAVGARVFAKKRAIDVERGRCARSRSSRACVPRRSAATTSTLISWGTKRSATFATRNDHRVRRAAESAFAAWGVPVPATRRYYVFVLDDLEARGGLSALHEALRDPLGVFRHNVATRLAERANMASVRPLAEATARLFAEPPTSTYDTTMPPATSSRSCVRSRSSTNPKATTSSIEGLRSENHQVRAVVADNAPDDERFVPELTAMLGDPRSFLRSRAEAIARVAGR